MNFYRFLFKKIINGLAVFLVASLSSVHLYAHPHNWIELQSSFVLDNDGQLVQIKQNWEFDAYYSLITYEDAISEHGSEEKGLREVANGIVRNLKSYNYFSSLKLDSVPINLNVPSTYSLVAIKKDGKMVLVLEMVIDLDPGQIIKNKELQWQVYDPTYYIAMNHGGKNDIKIVGGTSVCAVQLDIPEPSDDLIEYAQILDRNQKNTGNLGSNFAENITVNC